MAEMKARHAFGSEKDIQKALADGKINEYDILFLDEKKVGWITKDNEVVIAETDLSGIEAELETKANAAEVEEKLSAKADAETVKALETELANKVTAEEVDVKVETAVAEKVETAVKAEVEAAVEKTAEKTKYEITDVPVGTLVNYKDSEIRICCPENSVFTKQNVGAGGDSNSYYFTFKTFAPSDDAVGYIEHLNGQADEQILTSFNVDANGRRYQPTWLALAKYDESTDEWSYLGAKSEKNRYIGYDYQIDWFNADGVMIASDNVRINLSNENCHFEIEPYYVGKMKTDVETLVNEKIKEIESGNEIIEF